MFPRGAARQNLSHGEGQVALKNFSWTKALAVASLAAAAAVAFFMLIPPDMSPLWKANRSVADKQETKGAQSLQQIGNPTTNAVVASIASTTETGSGAQRQEEEKGDEDIVA